MIAEIVQNLVSIKFQYTPDRRRLRGGLSGLPWLKSRRSGYSWLDLPRDVYDHPFQPIHRLARGTY